ncbi:hypothetical protein BDL97_14G010800 [Sphagnum fallax]|nr:hypothetical protein BDL97_14G010800 [Sphagnum fallax]KAH8940935.1 hypothetical protein BDL97_14G010800 [Sphagnum fallax]
MQQMYRNFLTDLEKFGVASQTRPRMRAFGRSVTRPKDSFSVVFELAAKDDGKIVPLSMHLLHIRNGLNPQIFAPQAFALWILLESLMHMLQILQIEPVKNLLNGCSNGLLKPLLQPLSRFFTTICDLWFARDFRGQEKQ